MRPPGFAAEQETERREADHERGFIGRTVRTMAVSDDG